MLYEIITTSSLLAISGTAYYFSNKKSNNDHEKIKTIANEAGLKTKEEEIRIYRKQKGENYIEYVYKMPLGLSFKQFVDSKQLFVDGLNNKSKPDVNLTSLKNIDWRGDFIKQIQDILSTRIKLDKHLEIEYDGMLKFRVYDEGLKTEYLLTKEIMKRGGWKVALGRTYSKLIVHDFEKGPHILIGGTTDMGKSTLLNVIINTLIYNKPDDVEFTLIDLKGGLEFGEYEDLKQVKRFATNIHEAEKVLKEAVHDMTTNFEKLRSMRKRDIKQAGIKKRHFVIIDEAAELSSDGELDTEIKKLKIKCENHIKDLARRGRASGMRILYSTQYPTAETVSSQVKRNLITRICLPVDTSTASTVVLDEKGAEELPLIQGRAIYKRHRKEIMQSFLIEDKTIEKIITPHINIRPRGGLNETEKNREGGTDYAVFEETGLS